MNLVLNSSLSSSLSWLIAYDTQMPLYYILLYLGKMVFGNLIWPYKVLSLIFAALSLRECYRLARIFLGHERSLLTALMLGLSFIFVLHASELRPYSLLLFLSLIANRYLVHFLLTQKSTGWGYYFFSLLLTCLTHMAGFIFLASHLLLLLFFYKRGKDKVLMIAGGVLFVCLPLLPYLISVFNHQHNFRQSNLGVIDLAQMFHYLLNGDIFLAVAITIISIYLFRGPRKREKMILVVLFFLPILILFIKSILSAPAFEPRYIIYSLPVGLILLAKALYQQPYEKLSYVILFSSLLMNIFITQKYLESPYRIDSKVAALKSIDLKKEYDADILSCGVCLDAYIGKYDQHYICGRKESARKNIIYIVLDDNKEYCKNMTTSVFRFSNILDEIHYKGLSIFVVEKMYGR